MARQAPKSLLAYPPAIARVGFETPQLPVRHGLAGESADKERNAQQIRHTETRSRIMRRKCDRQRQDQANRRL